MASRRRHSLLIVSYSIKVYLILNFLLAQVSPFFKDQSLEATIKKINSFRDNFPDNQRMWDEVANKLQDVRVEVNYDRSRTFGIRGFTQMGETANNIRFGFF